MSGVKTFSNETSERYALALFELSDESNSLNSIEENSHSFLRLISNNKDLSNVIKDPTISRDVLVNIIL